MQAFDLINGTFEAVGSLAVFGHARAVYKDKMVRGFSLKSSAFFTSWALWNLVYYPHLDQWFSFAGGAFLTTGNVVWLALSFYYMRKEKHHARLLALSAQTPPP